jgi:hypothetical protein
MISPGDLLVFIAVVIIVAVFLKIVHLFITGGKQGAKSAEDDPQQKHETRAEAAEQAGSPKVTGSQSVSK